MKYLRLFENFEHPDYNGIIYVLGHGEYLRHSDIAYLFYINDASEYYKRCLENSSIDAVRSNCDAIAHFLNTKGYKFGSSGLMAKGQHSFVVSSSKSLLTYGMFADYGTDVSDFKFDDILSDFEKFKVEHEYVDFDLVKVEKIDTSDMDVLDVWW